MANLALYKTRLEKELARVNKRLSELRQEPEPEELASGGDNTPLSEEVDSALIAQERELRDKVLGGLMDRARALEQALRRVGEGTYGLCVTCRAKIPEGRLAVLPEVSLCAGCQAKTEEEASRKKILRTDNRSSR